MNFLLIIHINSTHYFDSTLNIHIFELTFIVKFQFRCRITIWRIYLSLLIEDVELAIMNRFHSGWIVYLINTLLLLVIQIFDYLLYFFQVAFSQLTTPTSILPIQYYCIIGESLPFGHNLGNCRQILLMFIVLVQFLTPCDKPTDIINGKRSPNSLPGVVYPFLCIISLKG
jgi:hypothetical protein